MKETFPSLNTKTPDGRRPNGRSYRVMVVENNDFQRKLLIQILESEAYDIVTSAKNGKEGLDHFKKTDPPPEIVITDLDMPVLDGYAMLYELNQKPTRPIVIFVSEETTKGVMQDLISMGIGDFILKPIERKVILERVKNVIKKANM